MSANVLYSATIATAKDAYARGETITVNVSNLPKTKKCDPNDSQNDCSWVGLFYAFDGSKAENLLAHQYATTDGDESFTFSGLDEAQEYEARVFFKNSYNEEGFYNFRVTSARTKIMVKSLKNSYQANEPITVHFSGRPGNNNDWIGLFKAYDESQAENLIAKIETHGAVEGDFTFDALSIPGEYEVRAFRSGSYQERDYYPFEVTPVVQAISPCNILQNSSFETDTSGWNVYGTTSLINDGHSGSKALKLQDGGLDQMSQKITGDVDTYQFNGYYKTVGATSGLWLGMVFYDSDKNVILAKDSLLSNATNYTKFIVNATAPVGTKYIETWFWADGKVVLDDLKLSTSGCYNYALASSLPPKGLKPNQVPQFVVLGFDDNTKAEGIDWAINMFKDKRNADGSKARVSFYVNTIGLHEGQYHDDVPKDLLAAMKRLHNTSHEIGDHTDTHFTIADGESEDAFFRRIKKTDKATWEERILNAKNDLIDLVGVAEEKIKAFRSPYLLYNQYSMAVLKDNGFLYDCSIEEGYAPEFDGTNFRWPYQLNEGSPGHNESWYGNPNNPERVDIKTIDGLWELPMYPVMIPKDSECAAYNIQVGLWDRLKSKLPYIEDHKFTGLDYNLWSMGEINKDEMLGILKYNLDLRLTGNRAPFMFGTHSQYYTKEWADDNAPNANVSQMRAAISEFVDYALSKGVVRIKTGADIIKWCENPQAL